KLRAALNDDARTCRPAVVRASFAARQLHLIVGQPTSYFQNCHHFFRCPPVEVTAPVSTLLRMVCSATRKAASHPSEAGRENENGPEALGNVVRMNAWSSEDGSHSE